MFTGKDIGGQWEGTGSVQSQVLVCTLRVNDAVLVLVISHRTFSQCRPGNVFSAPCA